MLNYPEFTIEYNAYIRKTANVLISSCNLGIAQTRIDSSIYLVSEVRFGQVGQG